MSQPINPQFLSTAIEAVVRAGDLQMAKFGTGIRVEKKGAIDLVTEVDVEVERMFRALVAERFPDHDVLAEELGGGQKGASHRWVFDPLDGTTNFAHGVPIFCASLGLEIDGQAAVAAVYDPNRKELFTAEAGIGSWLNGHPLKVSATDSVLESMLVTGFPYNVHQKADEYLKTFSDVLKQARAVRRLGSAAIDICWVAAGRMDGFWEASLKPWDTCAAALILKEAGGKVTGMDGKTWEPDAGHILATNGVIHEEVLRILGD
ncbi:MAG TPA: inositol monophosphatase family protein [Vicinamibacterales bacterium]|nr:inositol monophosphatase family protein [Vicinamibacterales bacterium]